MKKILIIMLGVLALGCSKVPVEHNGNVNFMVETRNSISESVKSNVSDFTTLPAASSFSIEIKDSYNTTVYNGAVADWSGQTGLAAGSYTVTASYGNNAEEGFDKPCFAGTASFTVKGGETTNVTIPVELSNCIVRVQTGGNFAFYYTDWTFTVKSGNGSTIPFPKDETRGAFVDAYKMEISGQLTSQSGAVRTFAPKEYQLSPATCYTLFFEISEVGGNSINIIFNDTVETVTLEDIELND